VRPAVHQAAHPGAWACHGYSHFETPYLLARLQVDGLGRGERVSEPSRANIRDMRNPAGCFPRGAARARLFLIRFTPTVARESCCSTATTKVATRLTAANRRRSGEHAVSFNQSVPASRGGRKFLRCALRYRRYVL
jgi:hypothetical protein